MQRTQSSTQTAFESPPSSPIPKIPETVFLLSISRDEDDAAAIRTDVKRAQLGSYKLQHCELLEDAASLLQVCSFDLAFLRLDDFQSPARAVERLRGLDPELPIIGIATGRLLSNSELANTLDLETLLRVEDISPSLLGIAVRSTLAKRHDQRERLRLQQELQLAMDAGQLGSWSYLVDDDRLELDPIASSLLGLPPIGNTLSLEKAMQNATAESHVAARSSFLHAAKAAVPFQCSLSIDPERSSFPLLNISGRLAETKQNNPRRLYGMIRRTDASQQAKQRIDDARRVVEAALEAARAELEELAQSRPKLTPAIIAPSAAAPKRIEHPSAQHAETNPAAYIPTLAPALDSSSHPRQSSPEPSSGTQNEPESALGINKQTAFQNVLRSLARQQHEDERNARSVTFPFDFSADADLDYSEPDPSSEGFVGAAKRLVSITQRGHGIRVSMSIDEPSAMESEAERDMIFDILKELLTNVVKHAKASLCIISLFRDEEEWVLQVEDDGVGLDKSLVSVSTPLNQIGLFRIRTQLALKGGHLDIAPSSPRGLVARARLPITLRRTQSHSEAERA